MSQRRRYRPRWGGWSFIAAASGFAVYAVVTRGGALEWFLLALLAGLTMMSLLLPIAAIRGIGVSRTLPAGEGIAGEELAIGLTLTRKLRLPLAWIAVEDTLCNTCSMRAEEKSVRAVFAPMFAKELEASWNLKGLKRGVYQLRSVSVTCGDPFGLMSIRREFELEGELLVAPAMVPADPAREPGDPSFFSRLDDDRIQRLNPGLHAEPSDGNDGLLTRNAGIGPDTRPYADGDSFRHLDFRAMARGRGLHTKVYTGAARLQLYVALDQFAAPYAGDDVLLDDCIGQLLGDSARAVSQNIAVTILAEGWTLGLAGAEGKEPAPRLMELRSRLARLQPSKQPHQWEGLERLGGSPMSGRTLRMYSADWRNGSRWTTLADQLGAQGFRLELLLFTSAGVLSYAMREQARHLEGRGIPVRWLQSAPSVPAGTPAGSTAEGAGAYALG
ncbi:DUF58 domain-containing protein [Paenibacillus sp. PL2-23]|uniref:DUF58 domain-containing protein n=1 Tax=Paenibacillus sp. PL2-23 TaxID=2100729 RepID=UPI0030FA5072